MFTCYWKPNVIINAQRLIQEYIFGKFIEATDEILFVYLPQILRSLSCAELFEYCWS